MDGGVTHKMHNIYLLTGNDSSIGQWMVQVELSSALGRSGLLHTFGVIGGRFRGVQ